MVAAIVSFVSNKLANIAACRKKAIKNLGLSDTGTSSETQGQSGRLHMSPVDRVGLVSEILPRHPFLYQNFDVFI